MDGDNRHCGKCGTAVASPDDGFCRKCGAEIQPSPPRPRKPDASGLSSLEFFGVLVFLVFGGAGAWMAGPSIGSQLSEWVSPATATPTATAIPSPTATPTATSTPEPTPRPTATLSRPTSIPAAIRPHNPGRILVAPKAQQAVPIGRMAMGQRVSFTVTLEFNSRTSYITGQPQLDVMIADASGTVGIWSDVTSGRKISWPAVAEGEYYLVLYNRRASVSHIWASVFFEGP